MLNVRLCARYNFLFPLFIIIKRLFYSYYNADGLHYHRRITSIMSVIEENSAWPSVRGYVEINYWSVGGTRISGS